MPLKKKRGLLNYHELMLAQDKLSSSHIPIMPKSFKRKFNDKFKKDTYLQRLQVNIVKYYKNDKPWYMKKNCKTKMSNNRNNYNNNNN